MGERIPTAKRVRGKKSPRVVLKHAVYVCIHTNILTLVEIGSTVKQSLTVKEKSKGYMSHTQDATWDRGEVIPVVKGALQGFFHQPQTLKVQVRGRKSVGKDCDIYIVAVIG